MIFSLGHLLKFVLYVALGMAALPVWVNFIDELTTGTPIPEHARKMLIAGAVLGAFAFFVNKRKSSPKD